MQKGGFFDASRYPILKITFEENQWKGPLLVYNFSDKGMDKRRGGTNLNRCFESDKASLHEATLINKPGRNLTRLLFAWKPLKRTPC